VEGSARKRPAEELGCSGGVVDEEEVDELWCCKAELDAGDVNMARRPV
jgi:hypothetical protein